MSEGFPKMKVVWIVSEEEERRLENVSTRPQQKLPIGSRININGPLTWKAFEQEIVPRLLKHGCVLAFNVSTVPSLMEWGAHLANTGRK